MWKAKPGRWRVFLYPLNEYGERPVVFRGDFCAAPKRIAQGRRVAKDIVLKTSEALCLPDLTPETVAGFGPDCGSSSVDR